MIFDIDKDTDNIKITSLIIQVDDNEIARKGFFKGFFRRVFVSTVPGPGLDHLVHLVMRTSQLGCSTRLSSATTSHVTDVTVSTVRVVTNILTDLF